jgi:2-polyprenyl-6-methoxyphenol hydroxylase-like FAD-dependent oxidoreductase
MPGRGATQCRGILSRWSGETAQFHDFELSKCSPGLAVERQRFHSALVDSVAARGITLFRDARVTSVLPDRRGNHARGTDCDGQSFDFRCRWVVDACGRGGSVCAPANARRKFFDGLIAVTVSAIPVADVDYLIVEASAHGWWYVGPSIDGSSQVIFLTDCDLLPSSLRDRVTWLADEFESTSLISAAFVSQPNFGTLTLADARFSARARVFHRQCVAVGDSAIALDPLSGLGTYTSLEGGDRVTKGIQQALGSGDNPILHGYVQWCLDETKRQAIIRRNIYRAARPQIQKSLFWQRRQ